MIETFYDLFKVGSQCGVLPEDVLDMTLDMFNAVVEGYSERLTDLQEIAVHNGYWAGYYGGSNRKKPVKNIIEKMEKARYKQTGVRAPDVDVESFLEMEQQFKERLEKSGGEPGGK